jgi:hypothetical protein
MSQTKTMSVSEFNELKFEIPKRMKYRNVKVEVDGYKFDSKKEAAYYGKLKVLKASGVVLDFKMQVRYDFVINGVKIGFYKSDFDVIWKEGGLKVTDAKGFKTPVYQLKKRLMKALYGIVIKEI